MTLRGQAPALDILITREISPHGSPPATVLNPLGQPVANPAARTVTQTAWARRYDGPVRDEGAAGDGNYFGVNDSRYLVRNDPVNSWEVNGIFIDEEGNRRRIVGVRNYQQQGHIPGALLELIGRT